MDKLIFHIFDLKVGHADLSAAQKTPKFFTFFN